MLRESDDGAVPLSRIAPRREPHLEAQVEAAVGGVVLVGEVGQRAAGSPAGRGTPGTRKGASASSVTTQGLTDVAKLLARKGPRGWYSHFWMSRADQSLTRHEAEEMALGLARAGPACPSGLPGPTNAPDLQLVVERAGRAEGRRPPPAGLGLARRPLRRRVPLTTRDEARPW